MPRLRLLLLGAAVSLALPASASAAVAPGVVMRDIVVPDSTYAALASTHVRWVRGFMNFAAVEPARGEYDQFWMNAYATWIDRLQQQGIKVLIDVVNAPAWATGSADPHYTPPDPAGFGGFVSAYSDFVGTVAHTFAGRVAAWEIWNEEDAPIWWARGPEPVRYAQLLKGAYPAIKASDPSAEVVLGGLTGNDRSFLEGVYEAGGAASFDAVGVHTDTACDVASPYSFLRDANGQIDQFSFLGYRGVHDVMVSHGDGAKPIWMTELGWSTSSRLCNQGRWQGQKPGGVSETSQATYLRQAFHCLSQDAAIVPVAIVFDLADRGNDTPDTRFGLLRANGSPKPALSALSSLAQSGDRLSGMCGNFTGPRVSFVKPRSKGRYAKQLPITVSASVSAAARTAAGNQHDGVARITLSYDGQHRIRNFTDRRQPETLVGRMVWDGAKRLGRGTHTLTALAVDSAGNQSSTTITVVHGARTGGRSPARRSHSKGYPNRRGGRRG